MNFLVDMNLAPRWVDYLVNAGFPAVHWSQIGRVDAPDVDLMQWAHRHDHVILTNDLDFSHLLATTQSTGPIVVQIRSGLLTPEAIGTIVLRALKAAEKELRDGALLTIDTNQARARIL